MEPADLGLESLAQKDFVVITPYLVDPGKAKKVNVGDGFIMDSALKLIGARPSRIISSRLPISDDDLAAINASRMVLVAGANTLKSSFEITPNFTPDLLDRIRTPVVLCGIGHVGLAAPTAQPLDAPSEAIMREILRRFPYVSVRCDASSEYLCASVPDLADQVLMTSCPVVFPLDGVDQGFVKQQDYDQVVLTVTDRQDLPAQVKMLQIAGGMFPAKRKVLALHQDYGNRALRDFARSLDYEVFVGGNYQDFLDLYKNSDFHLGNRVHAHLKCLSYGVRSFLTPFDLRQRFFSESLDFPLITSLPNPAFEDYDFRRASAKISSARIQMNIFVDAVRTVLDR
ncbi:MAG: polysaccharide pyruvyl transferase family protein [Phenylobacterium sp.]